MGSANTGWQHHPACSTSPQCLCILVLTLQKMPHNAVLPTAKGQSGEIPAAYPDLGRLAGTPGTFSPSVLGRRGTGHRERSWLWKPSQPCSGGPAPSLHCRSHTPGGAGQDLIQVSVGRSLTISTSTQAGTAQRAAKPHVGQGGGEEGWEMFSPRSTTEATTLYSLILQGCSSSRILKKSSSAAKTCFSLAGTGNFYFLGTREAH